MTTMVYRITTTQANLLRRRAFRRDSFFNPVQDADGLWFISREEVDACDDPLFGWVKQLRLVPYKPKPAILPEGITAP